MRPVSRILFTGDIFRTVAGESNQITNIIWLKKLVEDCIREITDLPISIAYDMDLVTYGVETVTPLYKNLELPPSLDAWAKIYNVTDVSQALCELVVSPISDAILVVFEMPPILQVILDKAEIPWIAIELDPLRFLPDLILNFRFSSHFSIASHAGLVTNRQVKAAVKHIKQKSKRELGFDSEGAFIFFAQTEKDKTLIKGDSFLAPESVLEFVAGHSAGRKLFVKPHPLSASNPVVELLKARLNGDIIQGVSAYDILSASSDVTILTSSSSIYYEAIAFGKTAYRQHGAVQDLAFSGSKSLWAHYSPSFWSALLKNVVPSVAQSKTRYLSEPKSNSIRKQLGFYGLDPETWSDSHSLEADGLMRWIHRVFMTRTSQSQRHN